VGTDTDWEYCECGEFHTLAVKTDGSLWSCGRNYYGQLGLGDTADRNTFTQISGVWLKEGFLGLPRFCGGNGLNANTCHSIAIKSDLGAYSAGHNYYGQLGVGTQGTGTDLSDMTISADSIPEDTNIDQWEFVVAGHNCSMALKVVESVAATINDDEEPQVWRLE